MKITGISAQTNNPNRVNVSVDGKYKFSLDIFQVSELGLRIGREYSDEELRQFEHESQFGKLYARSLEYCLTRPRSIREMRDYLVRKTRPSKRKSPTTGQVIEKPGVEWSIAERVLDRLVKKGYLDDEKFARFWVENRFLRKGISSKKLKLELAGKGVDRQVIESVMQESSRTEKDELAKIINKKQARYPDKEKFIQYLLRQGFNYDDINSALNEEADY